MNQLRVGGNRAGKQSQQSLEFAKEVTRLVRKSSRESNCGVTVEQAAGWTTATVDPLVPPGSIRYVRLGD